MEIQQEIAFAWTQAQVGKEIEVIVDGPDPEVPGHVLARGHADAPDIDCVGAPQGQGPAARRPGARRDHRRRRLRPDGPRDRVR